MTEFTIADLRHRLLIEVPNDEPDDAGGCTRTYLPGPIVWAAIQPIQGRSEFIADRRNMNITHKIIMRWRNDMNENMRFRLQERCFLLLAFLDQDQRKNYLTCHCEEVSA